MNSDDNYRIIVFDIEIFGVDTSSRILDPIYHNIANHYHIPDELLRWHPKQSVLANVRGV